MFTLTHTPNIILFRDKYLTVKGEFLIRDPEVYGYVWMDNIYSLYLIKTDVHNSLNLTELSNNGIIFMSKPLSDSERTLLTVKYGYPTIPKHIL